MFRIKCEEGDRYCAGCGVIGACICLRVDAPGGVSGRHSSDDIAAYIVACIAAMIATTPDLDFVRTT
jgi:hypothetical protein